MKASLGLTFMAAAIVKDDAYAMRVQSHSAGLEVATHGNAPDVQPQSAMLAQAKAGARLRKWSFSISSRSSYSASTPSSITKSSAFNDGLSSNGLSSNNLSANNLVSSGDSASLVWMNGSDSDSVSVSQASSESSAKPWSDSSSSNSSFGFGTFIAIEALGEIVGVALEETAGYGFQLLEEEREQERKEEEENKEKQEELAEDKEKLEQAVYECGLNQYNLLTDANCKALCTSVKYIEDEEIVALCAEYHIWTGCT